MPDESNDIAALVTRPLRLSENPVYTFYEGGLLWRQFRRSRCRHDSRWAEDWVASCIPATNADPQGLAQGLSRVAGANGHALTLASVIAAAPQAMLGEARAARWGPDSKAQVKLVAPSRRVPLHTHPADDFAQRYFGASCGKAEAWIVLASPATAKGSAYAGIGFKPDVTAEAFGAAVKTQDHDALFDMVHRTEIAAGDVIFVRPGVPHYVTGVGSKSRFGA
ncbi:MAG: hypothetical protein ACRDUT_02295 [Mycobacterium sp.]